MAFDRSLRRAACVLLTAALLVPAWGGLARQVRAAAQSEIDALKAEQAESQVRQEELKEQLAGVKEDQAAAQQKRQLLQQQLEAINAELDSINAQISYYDGEIARKEAERREAEAKEQAQYERFCERVRAMEEEGTVSYWSILFNAEDFSDLLDRLADVDAVMDYDNQVMEELTASGQERGAASGGLSAPARRSRRPGSSRRPRGRSSRPRWRRPRSCWTRSTPMWRRSTGSWTQRTRSGPPSGRTSPGSRRSWRSSGSRTTSSSRLPATAGAIAPASILAGLDPGYRMHPVDHVPNSHTGIDVAASTGVPIYAARGGQVIMSEYGAGANWSYGNFVVIDHGDGTTTLYAHMSSRAVSEGQMVSQGQTIGAVGDTGNTSGPHLHYEVRRNGQRTDPEAYYPNLPFIRAYNW